LSVVNTLFVIGIPYIALAVFVAGFIYRIILWAKSPVPFHIPTVCGQQKSLPWIKNDKTESPSSSWGVFWRMALEVLFFRSLFRNDRAELVGKERALYRGNRLLWLGGLAFHWSFLIILLRHLKLFLLGTAMSGILMRHLYRVDLLEIKRFTLGILNFSPIIPKDVGIIFYMHLFLVSALLTYFPFSKLMHLGGIFMSPTRNLKNDSRERRHINPWSHPVKVHTYAEWEDEFRDAVKEAGLPMEREK